MKRKLAIGWWGMMGCMLGAGISLAGPALPVTKPPVQSTALLTGPMIDPAATNGQWFINATGLETVRSNEFYDETLGGSAGFNAITGYVDSITYIGGVPGNPIVAFTIQATVYNDTQPGGSWTSGSNRHGETLTYQDEPYVGPLKDTELVAEFAIADTNLLPAVFQGPYRDRTNYIVALNEDQWAWYCWNPMDPNQEHKPSGNYFVPAWDFGTLQAGQSATRKLSFNVIGGLPVSDSRYAVLVQSLALTNDVLMNRSLSLKISTWIDEIAHDSGVQHGDEPPLRLSDVSVFHNGGEPEPYLDFGDAPDQPYPTLLVNDGARHVAVPGVCLGANLDVEMDGQPDATATGDDLAGLDDEDGVTFLNPLIASQVATVRVVASVSGLISAWVDFDQNGSWGDFGENVIAGLPVTTGVNFVTFNIPSLASNGTTFCRFRYTTLPVAMNYTGLILDGEVEDYQVEIFDPEEPLLDFGDAWDSPSAAGYPTLLINNGARHTLVPGIFLGQRIDPEGDGQPTLNADGDDLNPPAGLDDEDGVFLPGVLVAGALEPVQIIASTGGYLNAWIDFNSDGDWADPGEQVFANLLLAAGTNTTAFVVPPPPATASGGPQSRWRFTTYFVAAPAYTGAETNGEVEDYEVQLEVLDFGDAADPSYPTLLASDGARHLIPSAYYLGVVAPDDEPDGQPAAAAAGDDSDGTDDEDGVTPAATLIKGAAGTLSVTASTNGYLNAWMDFNADGDWADTGEQIATNLSLPPGTSPVPFLIPTNAQIGPVPGRYRFASMRGLTYTGRAADGEVEDHEFTIYQNSPDTNAFFITNIVHTASNQMSIWWTAETAVVYEAQFTTNQLSATDLIWNAWGGYVTGPANTQVDTNAAERLRYYRVVAPYSPPPP